MSITPGYPEEITVERVVEVGKTAQLEETSVLLRMSIWAEHLFLNDPVRVRSESMQEFRSAVNYIHTVLDDRLYF